MYLLILGANSDVTQALARKFVKERKANLYLASRDMEVLRKRAQDIRVRYKVDARPLNFDATDYASHAGFYHDLDPKPDGVIIAFGYLGNQKQAQSDFQEAKKIIETNYLGVVSILEIVAADFARRGHGFIIAISSVAGERGRQSNYIYGSAKGALTVYLSGLRNRLSDRNISVMTVLPGFIATKMTEQLELPRTLLTSPGSASTDIYKAYLKNKDIVYVGWYWRWIMTIIRNIPERFFKTMKL